MKAVIELNKVVGDNGFESEVKLYEKNICVKNFSTTEPKQVLNKMLSLLNNPFEELKIKKNIQYLEKLNISKITIKYKG